MCKKVFGPEEIGKLRKVSCMAIAADGSFGAYQCCYGGDDGILHHQIVVVDLKSGCCHTLETAESENRKKPQFTDGGKTLLYISDVTGEDQLFAHDMSSGTERQLTTARHGILDYQAPVDGGPIALELSCWKSEIEQGTVFVPMTHQEKTDWLKKMDREPYVVETLMYKHDAWFGMRKGDHPAIALVQPDGSGQQVLTADFLEGEHPAIAPDGKSVAFLGYPYRNAQERTPEVFLYHCESGEHVQLTDDMAVFAEREPLFTEDGNGVIYDAIKKLSGGAFTLLPYLVNISGGERRFVMGADDEETAHGWCNMVTNHTSMAPSRMAQVCGNTMYFISSRNGRGNLYRINLAQGAKVETEILSRGDIHSFAIDAQGDILFAEGTTDSPAEVYFRPAGGEIRQISFENRWLSEYKLAQTEEFYIPSKDGKVQLQCWLTHPVGQKAGEKYPAVLYIHGGPTCDYHADFWHEFQALAGAGMAVIYTNPRGSVGYGSEFLSNGVAWKQEPVDDLFAAVDVAIERGFINEKQIGVAGGSYGGWMTNKLIGTTDRFAAAVSQRSLVNLVTSYGTGDMGFWQTEPGHEDLPLEYFFTQRKDKSLIRNVDRIKIPLLILHGCRDYRCSFEQAEQLFVAMKDRNPEVPVRLVAFPEENHELTRSGKLANQIRHLEEMVNWFKTYLRKENQDD